MDTVNGIGMVQLSLGRRMGGTRYTRGQLRGLVQTQELEQYAFFFFVRA